MYLVMLLLISLFSSQLLASEGNEDSGQQTYWTVPSGDRATSQGGGVYSAALHNRFLDIKANYEENGVHYYSDVLNSFGFQEVLDPTQEVIFCGAGDKNFSDAINIAQNSSNGSHNRGVLVTNGDSGFIGEIFSVKESSETVGFDASSMDDAIKSVLQNNVNAKGRFCYRETDQNVSYRRAGSSQATYCGSGQTQTYTDSVSGFQCQLALDINMKVGETRFVRQLQSAGLPTIAQGFIGCYADPISGSPVMQLVDNPSSCSPSSRSTCIRTCDWAEDVVCNPQDMPRWGGNQCGAYGTMIFKDEVINVNSSSQLSYEESTGTLFEGSAVMACVVVSSGASRSANWAIVSSECNPITD
jgi:hypothetical protein